MDKRYANYKCQWCHRVADSLCFASAINFDNLSCIQCGGPMAIVKDYGKFEGIEIICDGSNTIFKCNFENAKVLHCHICAYFQSNPVRRCKILGVGAKECSVKYCGYICNAQYVYLIDRINELTGQKLAYKCCRCNSKISEDRVRVRNEVIRINDRWVRVNTSR